MRDALLVTTTDTHLVLPDGRAWDRTTFSGPAFISKKAKNAHHDLLVLAQTTPQPEAAFNTYQASHQKPLLAIVLGAITTLVQHPIAPSLDTRRHLAQTAGAIAGRAAVVLSAVPRTGKAAIELAHEMAASFVQDLADAWLLRPDRQWSPNAWIISPKMDAILVHLDPLDVAFGRLAAGILVRHAPTPERWTNAFSPASAHEAMMQRTLLQALDQQVLATYAADASRLKPMAAKRARAFAKP